MNKPVNISENTWSKLRVIGDSAQKTIEFSRSRIAQVRAFQWDSRPWILAEDALLGTDTDRAIAHRIGRSSVAVSNRRKKLGIKITSRQLKAS